MSDDEEELYEFPKGQYEDDPNELVYRFVFHLPSGRFVYLNTGAIWPKQSVDKYCDTVRLTERSRPVKASLWIRRLPRHAEGQDREERISR